MSQFATPLAFKRALERFEPASNTGADFSRRRQLLVSPLVSRRYSSTDRANSLVQVRPEKCANKAIAGGKE